MIILFTIGFLVGICTIFYFQVIPNLYILFFVFSLFFIIYLKAKCNFFLFLLGISAGIFYVFLFSHEQLIHRLPCSLENKRLLVIGRIIELPELKNDAISFVFKTYLINGKTRHYRLKLNWYYPIASLHFGEKWQFILRLKQPHSVMNPGGFDYEAWLFQKRIDGVGYIVKSDRNKMLQLKYPIVSVDYLREKVIEELKLFFPNQSLLGFLTALLTGDRQYVLKEQWDVLKKTGTNHLIAIAGLHLGLLFTFVFFIIKMLWRRIGNIALYIPDIKAATIGGFLICFFYSALAGFSIQTKRALLMLFFFLIGLFLNRHISPWRTLFLTLFFILIFNPLSVLSESFWLSFVAVIGILYGTLSQERLKPYWKEICRIQYIITISLIPMTLSFFHEVNFVSIFANIVAVPWFGVVIIPLCFLGGVFLLISHHFAYLFLWVALKNLEWLWRFLVMLAHFPLSYKTVIDKPFYYVFIFSSVFLILFPKGIKYRYLFIIFLLPIGFYTIKKPSYGSVWFTLFDVGQGLASIIQTENHVIIFDTGIKFNDQYNSGNTVIIPYLQYQHFKKIDLLVVSHGDNDHIGGAQSLIQQANVKEILTSVPGKFSYARNIPVNYCQSGIEWVWDGVHFSFLSPRNNKNYLGNNSSCVLLVAAKEHSILLPGDIEAPIESQLVGHRLLQPVTILVAPHHGSKTSSTLPFVKSIHPQYVLYAVGYLNRFHFPNPTVVKRYKELKINQLETDQTGAITFRLNNRRHTLYPILYRVIHHHIWNMN